MGCIKADLDNFKKLLKSRNINIGNLTSAELDSTLGLLMDSGVLSKGFRLNDIDNSMLQKIADAIADKRNERKAHEHKVSEEKKSLNMIGKAQISLQGSLNKMYPYTHKDTLVIFEDNMQAFNALTNKIIKVDGLIEPEGGTQVDVNTGASRFRTPIGESKGFSNTVGFTIKLNAQRKDGTWISAKDKDYADAIFKEEHFDAFVEANQRAIDFIKQGTSEKGEFTKVSIPKYIGVDFFKEKEGATIAAYLPKKFADKLKDMIQKELGINVQLVQSDIDENLWGLELQLQEKESKKKGPSAKAKEAMESLNASNPYRFNPEIEKLQQQILNRTFPNIAERRARINLIAQMFTRQLDIEVAKRKAAINKKANIEAELDDADYDSWIILNYGSEFDQRRHVLSTMTEDDNYTSYKLLNQIKDLFNALGSLAEGKDIPQASLNLVVEKVIKNPNNIFGAEYAIERETSGEVSQNVLLKRAENIIRFAAQVANTPDLFESLVEAASETIERNENIKLSRDKSRVLLNKDELDEMDESDETSENRAELYLIKQKLTDPKTTLSYRIKSMLNHSYKVEQVVLDEDGNKIPVYAYNDLGMRTRLNGGVVYYDLLKRFSKMNDSTDFDPMLAKVEEEYPWFIETAEKIKSDFDLRCEFYRCFRQVPQIFAVISPNGNLQFKNGELDATALIDIVSKNYEGCNILSETSLYDHEGLIDMNNVKMFRRLFNIGKDKGADVLKYHPLAYAHSILSPSSKKLRYDSLQTVHDILMGNYNPSQEEGRGKITSLDNILQSLGIDTSDMQMQILLPYIDWDEITSIEDIDEIWSKESRDKLFTILDAVRDITSENTGLKPDNHLINNFRGSYLRISNSLTGISEGYTQASFYFEGSSRFSYTHPDSISRMVGTISDVSSPEAIKKGTEFIARNYIMPREAEEDLIGEMMFRAVAGIDESVDEKEAGFAFFRKSPLIAQLNSDMDARRNFARVEVLALQTGGSNSKSEIGNITDKNFLTGIVSAYFSGHTILSKEDGKVKSYGWFRNPLFSDTESLNLFRLERIKGVNYKENIVEKLIDVAEAEIERILDFEEFGDKETIAVDNYNTGKKNAGKFNFLTGLNDNAVIVTTRKDGTVVTSEEMSIQEARKQKKILDKNQGDSKHEIVNSVVNFIHNLGLTVDSAAKYNQMKREYLRGLISKMMEEDCADFLDYVEDDEKLKLYNIIRKNVDEAGKITEQTVIFGENDEDGNTGSDEESVGKHKKNSELTEAERKERLQEVNQYLEEFYYNDFYAQSQLITLLAGDLAYYKNIRDFIKRNKQSYASGEKMYALDESGNPIMETALYLNDKIVVSNSFTQIKELLRASDSLSTFEKDIIEGALSAITKINSTDGQAFRTLKSFKKIYKGMGGMWNKNIEKSFENIANGQMQLTDFMNLLNAIKPFMFTYEVKQINGRWEKVPVQHKNSEYLLSSLFSALNTALNKSPELKALQKFCELHDIDTIQFKSCVKVGCFNPLDLNYAEAAYTGPGKFSDWMRSMKKALVSGKISQEEYNEEVAKYGFVDDEKANREIEDIIVQGPKDNRQAYIEKLNKFIAQHPRNALATLELQLATIGEENAMHVLPMEDYMIAQPNADHLTGARALIGSQGRNIIPADLSDDFETTININGVNLTFNKDQIIELYDTLFTDQILEGYEGLDRDYSDIRKVKKALDAAMENNPKYGPEVRRAFELDEQGTRFIIPTNSPTTNNKAQDLILSPFKNHIQKLYIEGGNAVLVSNFGLSHGINDELHVHYKTVKDSKGREHKTVDYIPCYLPATCKEMFKDFLIEHVDEKGLVTYTMDFDAIKEAGLMDDDILKMIGYRIPTEDKYSMMPLKVVGFLPIQAGGTIMLPSDIVALSGTDFDIDKLFLMRKAFRAEKASSALGFTFNSWANENNKSVDKGLLDELGIKDKDAVSTPRDITRKEGFTEEEINELRDKYEVFNEFIEAVHPLRDKPKYVSIKSDIVRDGGKLDASATSKMENVKSKSLRQTMRNNMLIDLYYGILTSPEGAKQMMTSASYDHIRVSARQQIISNDPTLIKAFREEYGEYVDKYGSVYLALNHADEVFGVRGTEAVQNAMDDFIDNFSNEDNPCDILFYIRTHRNLMDGNGLIGGFAVNSSRHYKFQLFEKEENGKKVAGLRLKEENQFKINIPGYGEFTISQIDARLSPITGVPIGRICSEFQAASPDNGKDPNLGYMGVSMNTLRQTNFMTAIGFPVEVIGFLNKCGDVLAEGNRRLGKKREKFKRSYNRQKWVLDIAKISEIAEGLRLGENVFNPDSAEGKENIDTVKKFAIWWENLLTCANDLAKASVFVRSDSPNGALAVLSSDVLVQLLKIENLKEDIRSGKIAIEGLGEIIDLDLTDTGISKDEFRDRILKSPLRRLQAFYSCGIRSAVNLVDEYLPELSRHMLDQLKNFQFLTGVDLTEERNLPLLRSYINEMTTYMISTASFLRQDNLLEERNYYLHDFPMKYKKFLDEKDSKGRYVHKAARDLTLIRMMTNISGKGIKFKNVGGKISPDSRQNFTDGLDFLLINEAYKDFGVDLFKYAYYENGLLFGHSNYGLFFSTAFCEAMTGFADALREGNDKITNGDTGFLENYTYQHLMNHPNLIAKGPGESVIEFSNDSNIATINMDKLSDYQQSMIRGTNHYTGRIEFRKFIRLTHTEINSKGEDIKVVDVYELSDKDSTAGQAVYIKIPYNSMQSSTPFYDASRAANAIEWEQLKCKGAVISSKIQEKIAKQGEKKKDINKAPSETAMKAPVDSAEPQLSGILNEETQDATLVSEASFFSTAYGDELNYDEILYPEAQAMQKIEEEQQEEPDLNDAPTTDEMCATPIKQVKFKKE